MVWVWNVPHRLVHFRHWSPGCGSIWDILQPLGLWPSQQKWVPGGQPLKMLLLMVQPNLSDSWYPRMWEASSKCSRYHELCHAFCYELLCYELMILGPLKWLCQVLPHSQKKSSSWRKGSKMAIRTSKYSLGVIKIVFSQWWWLHQDELYTLKVRIPWPNCISIKLH